MAAHPLPRDARARGARSELTARQSYGNEVLESNDRPDEAFLANLAAAFVRCEAHEVRFENPLQKRESANTVYVARRQS